MRPKNCECRLKLVRRNITPEQRTYLLDLYEALMAVTVSCIKSGFTLGLTLNKGRMTDKRALEYFARIERKFKKKREEYCFENNRFVLGEMLKDLKNGDGNGSH